MSPLKTATKYCIFFAPRPLKERIARMQADRELKRGLEITRSHKVSKAELDALLDKLDLTGDMFLHASTTNIGKMQGGAKHVCEALLSRVDTSAGTLLASALPYRGAFYDYLRTPGLVFDVRTAPVAMGAVNERLEAMPGAVRSIHPTHSVIALGKDARWYAEGHQADATPFGPNSPYLKLFKRRGKILLLGATLNNLTAVHALEDLMGEGYPRRIYADRTFTVECVGADGERLQVETKCHHPLRCATRDVERLRPFLQQAGAIVEHPCGAGRIALIDSAGLASAWFQMLRSGVNIYGKHRVTPRLLSLIDQAEALLHND